MPLERQRDVSRLVVEMLDADGGMTPPSLKRPGAQECEGRWELIQRICADLTDAAFLPDTMPPRVRRVIDCVLVTDGHHRILEFDEKQQFNIWRRRRLAHYGGEVCVAFRVETWIGASAAKRRLAGGGFAKPRPPLFPGAVSRHQLRAFRDALADILPAVHAWKPTLRIADFEVEPWLFTAEPPQHMRRLLEQRLCG